MSRGSEQDNYEEEQNRANSLKTKNDISRMLPAQLVFLTEHGQWGAGGAEPCKGGPAEQEGTTEL